MPDLRFDDPLIDATFIKEQTVSLIQKYPHKINWFLERGYSPHFYQLWFHCAQTDNLLTRWRSLVAGRRGGKTLSAAWEMAYYMCNPLQWWIDTKGEHNAEAPWWWFVAKDHTVGLAGHLAFRDVMSKSGLIIGKDYKENRNDKFFEIGDGRVDFRSAENPASLVGSGLNGIWIDESAKIPTDEAWLVVRPCLSDKVGCGIFTTTPEGKNWFYDYFHSPEAKKDKNISRVEYRSIDNTYFRTSEWEEQLAKYPPLAFKREYMASFDAFTGRDLQADWLKWYEWEDLPLRPGFTKGVHPGDFDLDYYIGIDPAISVASTSDHFGVAVIGVPKQAANRAYLIDVQKHHIKFAEQLDLINELNIQYSPQYIGIERTAYQLALVQQAERLDSFPNILEIKAGNKKVERIISMSPSFRVGKVLLRKDQNLFIDEWIDYDTENKNANDDALDAVEIALRTAGILTEQPVKVLSKREGSGDEISDWIWSKRFNVSNDVNENDEDSEETDYWPADYVIYDDVMGAEY